jgi:nucleoid DNA-binding protein
MKKVCKSSNWNVKLRAKKKPRFKPGSELSEKVNIMHVDIEETEDDQHESSSVNIEIEKENKERIEISMKSKGTPRYKASGDLTEKVNEMEIDLLEEITGEIEISELKLVTKAKENEHRAISVKRKSKPRFKAGADLTDKVNKIDIEISEEIEEDFEVCEIAIRLKSNACNLIESAAELN